MPSRKSSKEKIYPTYRPYPFSWGSEHETYKPPSALNYRLPVPEAVQPWPPDSATPRLTAMAIQTVGLT